MFVAAVIGSSLAFLIARYVARPWVEKRIAASPGFAAIDRAIAQQGRRIVFLLRLSPAFPFNLLNYALGLTRVRFADALVASLGMLPGTLLYVYYGKLAGEVATLAGGATVAARRRLLHRARSRPRRDAAVTTLVTAPRARTARGDRRDCAAHELGAA